MNWLLIIILIAMALCILYGYYKGFIRIMYSLVSIVLLIAFVTIATPHICSFLENHTSLKTTMVAKCMEQLGAKTEDGIQDQADSQLQFLQDSGIELPDGIWNQLLESGVETVDLALEDSGIYETIAESMAHFVINGISFFASMVIASILLFAIARVLNLFSKLPVIRGVNHFLGVVAGFVQGMIMMWLFFYLVAVCCTSSFGIMMTEYISQSTLLSFLYNHNPVLYVIMLYIG